MQTEVTTPHLYAPLYDFIHELGLKKRAKPTGFMPGSMFYFNRWGDDLDRLVLEGVREWRTQIKDHRLFCWTVCPIMWDNGPSEIRGRYNFVMQCWCW